ncbi:hypothetical protein SAMN05216486_1036 [bacterium JGI 053]|nr:hypothetical protein SAMN05216486_1036 [bacterium JGI 053]
MKRLRLNVEELDVAEFRIDAADEGRGERYGNRPSYWYSGRIVCPREPAIYSCYC